MGEYPSERFKAILTIIITAAVNIANIYGWAVDADIAVTTVLTVASFACVLWSWWKNQNVTDEAAKAQVYLDHLKLEEEEGPES